MSERPILDMSLDSKIFKEFYYLKEELVIFCRNNNLQDIYIGPDKMKYQDDFFENKRMIKRNNTLFYDTKIESNFVCSEKHRKFYKEQIGDNFSFNVLFQKWLKNNAGKTYQESIQSYYQILEDKRKNKATIDKQFEYNTYVRDFFSNNKDKSLDDAIKCWKYKKSLKGHNKYEKDDLIALSQW